MISDALPTFQPASLPASRLPSILGIEPVWNFEFGIWHLFDFWYLEFGILIGACTALPEFRAETSGIRHQPLSSVFSRLKPKLCDPKNQLSQPQKGGRNEK
jgi:hypothetical protein